ncbi:hypothetical protein ACLOJK_017549 [Asimina triloba]
MSKWRVVTAARNDVPLVRITTSSSFCHLPTVAENSGNAYLLGWPSLCVFFLFLDSASLLSPKKKLRLSISPMAAAASSTTSVTERRGIPAAAFVEDVQSYLAQAGIDANTSLGFLQERSFLFSPVSLYLPLASSPYPPFFKKYHFRKKRMFVVVVVADALGKEEGQDKKEVMLGVVMIAGDGAKRLQQYRLVEMKLLAQQRDLQAKIPDIEKCLDIVATLQAKKSTGEALIADFEVSEGIFSQARIEDTDSVCLWLGANVMLEYSFDEANALLRKNLENAKASLEVLIADLQFLRDQVTTTQVTLARVYNWDVQQRRSRQAAKES